MFSGRFGLRDAADLALSAADYRQARTGFARVIAGLARTLRGTDERELVAAGRRVHREQLAAAIFPETRALVAAHLEQGHTVAISTAATRYQAEPVARELGIRSLICTRLEVEDGRLTGRVLEPVCYGQGKCDAAMAFARRRRIDLAKSYFYTDGHEDLPLLEAVGYPRPTNPDRKLQAIADERGWPVRSFERPDATRPSDAARTLLLTGMIPYAAAGTLATSLFAERSRAPLELCMRLFGAVAAGLAGVELRIRGEQHLQQPGPALFVFNHGSAIDPLLVARIVPQPFRVLLRGSAGPGSSRLLRGAAAMYQSALLLEPNEGRGERHRQPAIRALRAGTSLVAAPEDTSTPSPSLAEFRLMPFRIALEARVPIVPVVLENSTAILPAGTLTVRPGCVDVEVLPAIDTREWQPSQLPMHVERIRKRFARALGE